MKHCIESAELARMGASTKALTIYDDTDPLDIYRLDDGTYEILEMYPPTKCENVLVLLSHLDAMADETRRIHSEELGEDGDPDRYAGENSVADPCLAARELFAAGWRADQAEQIQRTYTIPADQAAAIVEELAALAAEAAEDPAE